MTAPGATGLGFTGIGVEATKGTAVAATHTIPVTRAEPDEAQDVLPDQGMRNSMATLYGAVKGVRSATFDMEGDVYLDTIGFFLSGILGEVTTTGSASPFTHTFNLLNTTDGQCPSLTIEHYDGDQARKYAGATLSSLSIRCSAQELLTYSASFTTQASEEVSAASTSFTALDPIAGWVGTAKIANTTTAAIEEAEVTLSRNVSLVHTVSGDQDPVQIWQGPLSVSGRLMLVGNDDTEFDIYKAVTTQSLQLVFTQSTSSLTLTMSEVVYTSAKIETGDDYTQVSIQFDAIANSTDKGSAGLAPIEVTLVNAIESGTYD